MAATLVLCVTLLACSDPPAPQLANGASCAKYSECTSGVCYAGVCQSRQVGAACDRDKSFHCDGQLECFDGTCRERGKLGERCVFVANCEPHLECYQGTCLDAAGKQRKDAELAAAERKRLADKLAQAGLDVPAVAEKPAVIAPAPESRAIRTVTGRGSKLATAVCGSGERLIGGGCKADQVQASYPSGQTATDTLGAAWSCTARAEVTAYALCAPVR